VKVLSSIFALIALALIAPAGAAAATSSSTSDVTGIAGTELALAAATPAAMTLTHSATPPTATSVVTVTSTSLSWTLSISDQDASGSGTSGRMDKVNCGTGALLGGSLLSPLQWSPNGTTFADLSGTAATVGTGSLVDAKTVTYRQSLGATEDVAVGDCYKLTATYTVTDV
jgi:hypothetical protein